METEQITLEELKIEKQIAESTIQDAIDLFTNRTGFVIQEINISTLKSSHRCGTDYIQTVTIKAFL